MGIVEFVVPVLPNQAAPRVWISDGQVTGVGDRSHAALSAEVADLCARARIVRVANGAAASAALLGETRCWLFVGV